MDKKAFLSWCVSKRNLKKNSMKSTRIRYDLFFKWLGRRKLTFDVAAEYKLYLVEKGLRNVSINTHLRVIRLIDIYQREFHTDLNLFKKIDYLPKEKRIPVILNIKEINSILSVIVPYTKRFSQEGWEIDLNRNLAFWVIASTGCRLNECLSLRKCDIVIGLEKGNILIQNRPDFTVKNDLSHKVPLPNNIIVKLKNFLEKREPKDLAFQSAAGNKLSSTIMEDDWHRRLALAGITTAPHIHDLRASYIMEHLRKKTPLPEISKLVGHKDVQTTIGYMAFNDDDLWDAAKNHPFFVMSETPLEKTEKFMNWVEKIRHELEYNGQFLSAERKETLRSLLEAIHKILENTRICFMSDKQ
ncbi:MAG TPA: site-specific integrase [Methylomirabilota bacterium]|nr:site-specific integrase [Methylomirabilota bacterium]